MNEGNENRIWEGLGNLHEVTQQLAGCLVSFIFCVSAITSCESTFVLAVNTTLRDSSGIPGSVMGPVTYSIFCRKGQEWGRTEAPPGESDWLFLLPTVFFFLPSLHSDWVRVVMPWLTFVDLAIQKHECLKSRGLSQHLSPPFLWRSYICVEFESSHSSCDCLEPLQVPNHVGL